MEPTSKQFDILKYELGKHFSGRQRCRKLKEQLLQSGFEINSIWVYPLEWDGSVQPYVNHKPVVANVFENFWRGYSFQLHDGYLIGEMEPGTSVRIVPPYQRELALGDMVHTFQRGQKEMYRGKHIAFISSHNYDDEKLEPLVRRVKDICDRL